MILTDDFVLINCPKTGSSFARTILREVYTPKRLRNLPARLLPRGDRRRYCSEYFCPKTEFLPGLYSIVDQHGHFEQVPASHRQKPVLSVARDPIQRDISNYEYGWWRDHPVAPRAEIEERFPGFPAIDFRTFLAYQNFNNRFRRTGVELDPSIGNQTVVFIQFYFRDPLAAFRQLDDDYIESGRYRQDLPPLTLLRTESLNDDLYRFLRAQGWGEDAVGFVRHRASVRPENTHRRSDAERASYLDAEVSAFIRHKERYLYRIYADLGVDY